MFLLFNLFEQLAATPLEYSAVTAAHIRRNLHTRVGIPEFRAFIARGELIKPRLDQR